jgi:hypothetical protein
MTRCTGGLRALTALTTSTLIKGFLKSALLTVGNMGALAQGRDSSSGGTFKHQPRTSSLCSTGCARMWCLARIGAVLMTCLRAPVALCSPAARLSWHTTSHLKCVSVYPSCHTAQSCLDSVPLVHHSGLHRVRHGAPLMNDTDFTTQNRCLDYMSDNFVGKQHDWGVAHC